MGRRTELETKHQGEWFRLPLLLQESYDSSVDLDIRLRLLIEGLRNVHALLTIDQEILVLAAAVRLLVRVRARQFARLLYGDFTAYSYQLTDGKSADPLGLLSDLEDRLTVAAQTIP